MTAPFVHKELTEHFKIKKLDQGFVLRLIAQRGNLLRNYKKVPNLRQMDVLNANQGRIRLEVLVINAQVSTVKQDLKLTS